MLYVCSMRKNIDIPDEIKTDLKIMAAKADMPLKNFIEKILTELVEGFRKGSK